MRALAEAVAQRHGVTLADLKSHDATRRTSVPRQEAMFLIRVLAGKSYPEIGAFLNRDPSTVQSGIAKHIDRAAGERARGIAARIEVKIIAEMMDSPAWASLSPQRAAELKALAGVLGRELADPVVIAVAAAKPKDIAA